MTSLEASRLLELPVDATPAQVEARFNELRAKLEDKIAKAPTPGLREKYRATLAEITTAFETLVLAADSSTLPVLKKEMADGRSEMGTKPSPPPQPDLPSPNSHLPTGTPSRRRSGGKEFLFVALVAILVLVAGGWWVLEQRAARAEEARVAAERQQEADRQRAEAEARRRAEEAEQARLAAAAKEEQARIDRLVADLRTKMAEARVVWESYEREERRAEREASELKGELRSLRDAAGPQRNELTARAGAAQRYHAWLTDHLGRTPVRMTRAKIEEMIGARLADEAQTAFAQLVTEFQTLAAEVKAEQERARAIEGELALDSDPSGLAFELVDAFGRPHQGTTPAVLTGVAPGEGRVTLKRAKYQDTLHPVSVQSGRRTEARLSGRSQAVTVRAEPDVEIWSGGKFLARGEFTLHDHPPADYNIELRRKGFKSYVLSIPVKQVGQPLVHTYNFGELAVQNIPCQTCSQRGYTESERDCSACDGYGTTRCTVCGGDGIYGVINNVTIRCTICGGDGQENCGKCGRQGTITTRYTCNVCGGDGLLSKLDAR